MQNAQKPGQALARGVCRHLRRSGFECLEEFTPRKGLRVDVMALGPRGDIWIVECKSSREDFLSDRKWSRYLEFCDMFLWAVDTRFPAELLPGDTGLILADAHDAETIRMGAERRLAPARRRKVTLDFARACAGRLQALRDPPPSSRFGEP